MSSALVSPRTPLLRASARSSPRDMLSSPRTLAACTAPFEGAGAAAFGAGGAYPDDAPLEEGGGGVGVDFLGPLQGRTPTARRAQSQAQGELGPL